MWQRFRLYSYISYLPSERRRKQISHWLELSVVNEIDDNTLQQIDEKNVTWGFLGIFWCAESKNRKMKFLGEGVFEIIADDLLTRNLISGIFGVTASIETHRIHRKWKFALELSPYRNNQKTGVYENVL